MCLTPCPINIWWIFKKVLIIKLKRECWIGIGVNIGRVMAFQYEYSAFINIQCFSKCWGWCSLVINGNLWLDKCLQDQDLDRLSKCCLWWLVSCNQKALRIWNFQLLPGLCLDIFLSISIMIYFTIDHAACLSGMVWTLLVPSRGASLPCGIHYIFNFPLVYARLVRIW